MSRAEKRPALAAVSPQDRLSLPTVCEWSPEVSPQRSHGSRPVAPASRNYVLLTAARNEARYIERAIQAVLAQTALPKKWVIASDGSADQTDDIVSQYAAENGFMQLVRLEPDHPRSFAAKCQALRTSADELVDVEYGFIGNLDADITFTPDYYASLLSRLEADTSLGIVGGTIYESRWGRLHAPVHHTSIVAGAVQFFRRQCFEDIGGYRPIHTGGIDSVAVVEAKMLGWQVRTFEDLIVIHHRHEGSAASFVLRARFKDGVRDCMLGHHPLFQIAKCLRRCGEWPWFISSIFRVFGYLSGSFLLLAGLRSRPVSVSFVRFLRGEQLERIRRQLQRLVRREA
jgi:glycosyltransferase involved in cell wall biosynthesis